jgi:hypothetical protein
MNIICKIFGHKWDETDKYEQDCKRKHCIAFRTLFEKPYPKIGESKYDWEIIDFNKKLKLK